MSAWNSQWNGYEPGFAGALNVSVSPAMAVSPKAFPLSAVTVWFSPSIFITDTVAPGRTEAGTANLNFLM